MLPNFTYKVTGEDSRQYVCYHWLLRRAKTRSPSPAGPGKLPPGSSTASPAPMQPRDATVMMATPRAGKDTKDARGAVTALIPGEQ